MKPHNRINNSSDLLTNKIIIKTNSRCMKPSTIIRIPEKLGYIVLMDAHVESKNAQLNLYMNFYHILTNNFLYFEGIYERESQTTTTVNIREFAFSKAQQDNWEEIKVKYNFGKNDFNSAKPITLSNLCIHYLDNFKSNFSINSRTLLEQ